MAEVHYGPGIPGETELRLLGPLDGKRVLALGCRRPRPVLALAEAGAKVLAVDQSSVRVDRTRRAAEEAGLRIELHRADLAGLAFLRQESIDLALSVYALAEVHDLNRVFRQVHRTLAPNGPIVFSLPHPAAALVGAAGPDGRPVIGRSYFDTRPLDGDRDDVVDHHHGIGAVFTSLGRAGFRVDALLEPEPDPGPAADGPAPPPAWAPPTLIMRARKAGV